MLLKTLFLSSKTAESMMVIPALPKYMQYYQVFGEFTEHKATTCMQNTIYQKGNGELYEII